MHKTNIEEMRAKFREIASLLDTRIRRGDYNIAGLPGEKKLAEEFGVSYMTARKAAQMLISDGLLRRMPNGRLSPSRRFSTNNRGRQFALAIPSLAIRETGDWIHSIQSAVAEKGAVLRIIPFLNWDDNSLLEVFQDNYDGIFLLCNTSCPRLVNDKIRVHLKKVVTLFESHHEFQTTYVDNAPADSVKKLVTFLHNLGHRQIDCFNAMPVGQGIERARLEWEASIEKFKIAGNYHDYSALNIGMLEYKSYFGMKEILEKQDRPSALFCTTVASARGVYRALYEKGIKPGCDISVCARGALERAQLFTPALTCISLPEREAYIAKAIDWMLDSDEEKKIIDFRPATAEVYAGESCFSVSR